MNNQTQEAKRKPFMEPDLALDSYLSTLLMTLPSVEPEEEQSNKVIEAVIVEKPVILVPEEVSEIVPQKEVKKVVLPQVATKAVVTEEEALAVMPKYTQEEFSALFFKVGNLVVAAPLIGLSRTLKFEGDLLKIPQQPVWFMGLKLDQDEKVGILNMAYLIQGKSMASKREYVNEPFKNIILTEDSQWGLACDEVLSVKRIMPDTVRWRTNRDKKPWLIGTIIEDLVVIVDINKLVPQNK